MLRLYKNILYLLIFFFVFFIFTEAVEITKDLNLDIELWSKLYADEDYVSDNHVLDDITLDLRFNALVYGIDNAFVQVSFASLRNSQVWDKSSSILYYDGFFQKLFAGYEGEGYTFIVGLQDSIASEDFFVKEVLKAQQVGLKSNFFLLLDKDVQTLGFINPFISGEEWAASYRGYFFHGQTIIGASFIPKVKETEVRYGYKESALEGAISYNNANGQLPFSLMLSTRYYVNGSASLKRLATSLSTRVIVWNTDLRVSYIREFYLSNGDKHYTGLMYSLMYPLWRGVVSIKYFDSFIQETDAKDISFFYQAGYSYALNKFIFLELLVYGTNLDYSLNANVIKEKGVIFGLKYQYR